MEPPFARILVVDDEESIRDMLSDYFTERGYEVHTAEDGQQALAVVERQRPHLVLLDIQMPGQDGVETLRLLRELAPDVAVIMVTANEDVALARETLKLGALDYVAKPFDFDYLERTVMASLAHVIDRGQTLEDPWRHLAYAVFHIVRTMGDRSWASMGTRLEQAALRAAAEGTAGSIDAAGAALTEVTLVLSIAAEMRDLTGADVAAVQAALARARHSLKAP
jgi:DNA-binding response OmpR family regulator